MQRRAATTRRAPQPNRRDRPRKNKWPDRPHPQITQRQQEATCASHRHHRREGQRTDRDRIRRSLIIITILILIVSLRLLEFSLTTMRPMTSISAVGVIRFVRPRHRHRWIGQTPSRPLPHPMRIACNNPYRTDYSSCQLKEKQRKREKRMKRRARSISLCLILSIFSLICLLLLIPLVLLLLLLLM